jgi:hypothetical protein
LAHSKTNIALKNERNTKEILQQNDQLVFVQSLCDPKIAASIFNRIQDC